VGRAAGIVAAMRIVILLTGTLLACGDNSKQCGPGTVDEDGDGLCEALPANPVVCGDGTVLDEQLDRCVIDPSVCGDGTVLIRGECRDPSAELDIDLEEGPEPNGFEAEATPAGVIALPAVGDSFVLHGCIQPLDAATPDFDRYEVTVTGPTLIRITADGIAGLAAGFQVLPDPDEPLLASWHRLGINLATDMSSRQVWLPAAGTYSLVMTDTRTLLPITANGQGAPAAGNLDGSSCYYVTIEQLATPAATPFDVAAGHTGTIEGDVRFFTGPFPAGSTTIRAVIDPVGPGTQSRAASALVLVVDGELVAVDDADASSPVSELVISGVAPGVDVLLALDHVWNLALAPAPFSIARP
jgi:hypothetical protein